MGCDIHIRAEVRRDGQWQTVGKKFQSVWLDEKINEPYDGRNYDLFAMLANVRNGRGFAGIATGEGFTPVAMPKGLPKDACSQIQKMSDDWGVDGHSHSWLSLTELLNYDWNGQTAVQYGVVAADEYERLRETKQKAPEAYCGHISGGNIEVMTADVYDWRKTNNRLGIGKDYYVRMEWEETYRQAAGTTWFENLDRLQNLVPLNGSTDDVRIVFFFDN